MDFHNSDRGKRNEDKREDIVDWIYDEFQKFFELPYFKKQLKKLIHTILLSDGKYLYGLKINIEPIDKPYFCKYFHKKFGNYNRQLVSYNDYIKIHDILEGKKKLYITAEIQNVDRKDINLNLSEETVEITVDNHIMKYNKLIDLPSKILPKEVAYTFKNGIMDITLKKKLTS
jgi:HSP20 family protein